MQKAMVTYSVILPTYNERDNIPYLVWLIVDVFKRNKLDFELLLVDDCSPDGTADVYKELQRLFKGEKLLLLQRPRKLGLGSAYREGLLHTTGAFLFLLDADLSHHPKYIPEFIRVQQAGNYDIVTGSRYIKGGGVSGWDTRRIVISRGANFLAETLLSPHVTDLTGSFRLYKRDVLKSLLDRVQSTGFFFQTEVIVLARALKYSIAETPIVFVDRLYGQSKLGGNEMWQYLKGLLYLFWTV